MTKLRQIIPNVMWGVYGRHAWDYRSHQPTQDLVNRLAAHLLRFRNNPSEQVLDAGCGTGNFALRFAQAGFQVCGIDSSGGMIRVARKKISKELTQRLVFQRVSLYETLPYDDATFDHVVCVSVLQLLTNPIFTLSEFARLLKPQGHLTVVHFERSSQMLGDPGYGSRMDVPQRIPVLATLLMKLKRFLEHSGFVRNVTYTAVKNLVEQANFRITEEEGENPKILVAMKQ